MYFGYLLKVAKLSWPWNRGIWSGPSAHPPASEVSLLLRKYQVLQPAPTFVAEARQIPFEMTRLTSLWFLRSWAVLPRPWSWLGCTISKRLRKHPRVGHAQPEDLGSETSHRCLCVALKVMSDLVQVPGEVGTAFSEACQTTSLPRIWLDLGRLLCHRPSALILS